MPAGSNRRHKGAIQVNSTVQAPEVQIGASVPFGKAQIDAALSGELAADSGCPDAAREIARTDNYGRQQGSPRNVLDSLEAAARLYLCPTSALAELGWAHPGGDIALRLKYSTAATPDERLAEACAPFKEPLQQALVETIKGIAQSLLAGRQPRISKPVEQASAVDAGVPGGNGSILPIALPPRALGRFNLTDVGNAQRLAYRHGSDLRYCGAWKSWLIWTGTRWQRDVSDEITRRAKEVAKYILIQAAGEEDDHEKKALVKHALQSESVGRIRAMIDLAASEKPPSSPIPITPSVLDKHPWLLNCENGTLDLRTGKLCTHQRNDLITKLVSVQYDPTATCPRWDQFLEKVLPDKQVRAFLQRAVGYSLTADTRERAIFVLYGGGRNGKSTLQEIIAEVLGEYAGLIQVDRLLAKRTDQSGIPNDLANLAGTRYIRTRETEQDRRLAESVVKELAGGIDKIQARFLYGEWFEIEPTFKIWLSTNHRPVIRGTDNAIWDRIYLVPWNVRFWIPGKDPPGPPELQADTALLEALRAELPGILAWAVRGCLDWQRQGLGYPAAVRQATESYRRDMDVLAAFLDEMCDIGASYGVSARDLYGGYKQWRIDAGESAETQRSFGMRLAERGFSHKRGTGGAYVWQGLILKPAAGFAP